MAEQFDLFRAQHLSGDPVERFGRLDAQSGLPLRNDYSAKLGAAEFAVYEAGYRIGARIAGGGA